MRPKNSEKKLVNSRFRYYRFLSLVIVVCLRLALLYIRSNREIKISKLTKVLLWKNGSIVRAASLFKRDIL